MKRILSIVVSLAILAIIYWRIDPARMLPVFANCDPVWLIISLGMVVPITLFTSWRLQQLMPERGQLGFVESNKLILVASVLNLVLPSKMGDIAKAWFMRERGHLSGPLSLSLVVFEKACDMLSLLLWCAFGLFLFPKDNPLFGWMTAAVTAMLVFGILLIGSAAFARFFFNLAGQYAPGKIGQKLAKLGAAWGEMHGYFWSSPARFALVAGTSVFLWFLHLLQIWMFILALRAYCPFLTNLALSPLAILAGLLPLTFAGVGTRDAALIMFYGPVGIEAPVAAALGMLCTARYILPAIGGIPFVGDYLVGLRKAASGDRQGLAPETPPRQLPKRQSLVMRMFWYLAGGALSYGANIGMFGLLRWRLGLIEEVAYAISLALVMGLNFAWSYFVNFRTHSRLRSCLPRYGATQAAAYIVNYSLTQLLFEVFPNREKLVILAAAILLAGSKFLSYHFWVFPRSKKDRPD